MTDDEKTAPPAAPHAAGGEAEGPPSADGRPAGGTAGPPTLFTVSAVRFRLPLRLPPTPGTEPSWCQRLARRLRLWRRRG